MKASRENFETGVRDMSQAEAEYHCEVAGS
jgi:hypothetical protein